MISNVLDHTLYLSHLRTQMYKCNLLQFLKIFCFFECTTSTISKSVLLTEPISETSHNFSTSQPLTIPSGKISTNLPPALHGE